MEDQTNNNEVVQEIGLVENMEMIETAQSTEVMEQPEIAQIDEAVGITPDDAVTQPSQKKKKTLVIGLIIVALVLLFGGVGAGVYAFMNSPEMKIANAMTKIQKAKKLDGTMKLQGAATMPTILKTETIKLNVEGSYSASRNAEKDSYFKIDTQAKISVPKQLQETIDAMKINGNYSAVLTKDMIFNWGGLGQKGSLRLNEEQKQAVKNFVETDGTTSTDEQKAAQELFIFALKGYTPVIEGEGNKAMIKITKSELEKIIQTSEKNIASDSGKFEELYKKANKSTKAEEIKIVVENAKNGNITKQARQALSMVETLQIKVAYEDLGNQVKQTFNFDMTMKQAQGGMTINGEFNCQFDTTYSL